MFKLDPAPVVSAEPIRARRAVQSRLTRGPRGTTVDATISTADGEGTGMRAGFWRTAGAAALTAAGGGAEPGGKSGTASDPKPAAGAAGANRPGEIIARMWLGEEVDPGELKGQVVLLLFWQRPGGT